ncbi:MAG: hypothetical protein AAGG07_11190 [Planctomycetota bacterium]
MPVYRVTGNGHRTGKAIEIFVLASTESGASSMAAPAFGEAFATEEIDATEIPEGARLLGDASSGWPSPTPAKQPLNGNMWERRPVLTIALGIFLGGSALYLAMWILAMLAMPIMMSFLPTAE